jgi:PAS domain-containing protein
MRQPQRRRDAVSASDADIAILESSSFIATIVVADDGRIVAANARMRDFLGTDEAGAAGAASLHALLADANDWALFAEAPASGRAVCVDLRSPSGAVRTFRGDVRAVTSAAGRRFVGIFADGNNEQSLRTAAQHSARMGALGSLTSITC